MMPIDMHHHAGKSPTPMQLKILESYTRLGSQKAVAHELDIALQTVKNHLSQLYLRLDVGGVMEALSALGWIKSPVTTCVSPCGWLAYCGRPEEHRGNHGGFRPFIKKPIEEVALKDTAA